MKIHFFLAGSLTALLNTTVLAGNEGPQAQPQQPDPIVAQYVVESRHNLKKTPWRSSYMIYSIGQARVIHEMSNGRMENKFLKNYNATEMKSLKALIKSMNPGKLREEITRTPNCRSNPSATYTVYNKVQEIVIATSTACKKSQREDANDSDRGIIKILDDLTKVKTP